MMRLVCAAALSATLAVPAAAATVEFDFTGGDGGDGPHVFVQGLLTLTVGGTKCTPACAVVDAQRLAGGFGIKTADEDSELIDGANGIEIVTLSFDRPATVDAFGFGSVDEGDDVSVLRIMDGVVVSELSGMISQLEGRLGVLVTVGGAAGTLFAVAAPGADDAYLLRGLVASYEDPDTGVPPIPLPAAGWMLLAGLGGLAGLRRLRA